MMSGQSVDTFLLVIGCVLPRYMSVFMPLVSNVRLIGQQAQMVRAASRKFGEVKMCASDWQLHCWRCPPQLVPHG
jgi:hypothetical protein